MFQTKEDLICPSAVHAHDLSLSAPVASTAVGSSELSVLVVSAQFGQGVGAVILLPNAKSHTNYLITYDMTWSTEELSSGRPPVVFGRTMIADDVPTSINTVTNSCMLPTDGRVVDIVDFSSVRSRGCFLAEVGEIPEGQAAYAGIGCSFGTGSAEITMTGVLKAYDTEKRFFQPTK